jgi:hypothetical protein
VERGVEHRDVRHMRQDAAGLLDRGQSRCVVERGEVCQLGELACDRVVDRDGVAEPRAPVDDAVRDRDDLRGRGLQRRNRVARAVGCDG